MATLHRKRSLAAFGLAVTLATTALAQPPAVRVERPVDPGEGWWEDRLGQVRPFEQSYADWSPERYEARPWRAAAEMLVLLGLGTAWYWVKKDQNIVDWDYPSLEDRILTFDAVRFDNNLFVTNHILHPAAGSAYYGFSRVNGLSPFASIGYSFATSAAFEFGLEVLEKVSINDLIYTPLGAWASGEWFFQLGDYLNSGPRDGPWGNRLAAYTLGSPRYLHDAWDGAPPPRPLPLDNLGLSTAFWHRFGVTYGLSGVDNDHGQSGVVHDVLLEGELIRMPGHLRPGQFERAFGEGNFVDMRTRMSFDGTGFADLDIFFSADIAGYYHQRFERAPGGISGQAWSGAVNSQGRFVDRWLLSRRDGYAVAHLPGPALRGWIAHGPMLLRLSATAHLDFAAIRALPWDRWVGLYGSDGVKTVLQKESYYYAHGSSANAQVVLSHGTTELGLRGFFGHYESIEGLDREQETVYRDVHDADQILEGAAWLGHTTPGAPIHLRVTGEQVYRTSKMTPIQETRWDRRISVNLGLGF